MQNRRISFKWAASFGGVVSLVCVPAIAQANLAWTGWVSEENPPAICPGWDEGAVGFGCRGKFCDDVRLLCETAPFGITFTGHKWSGWFSEEDSGLATKVFHAWFGMDTDSMEVCRWQSGLPGVVTGIQCSGKFCDNIAIECGTPVKNVGGSTLDVTVSSCGWTGWKSEEQGSTDFGPNRYITGVECRGSYCDDKRFFVCSLVNPG